MVNNNRRFVPPLGWPPKFRILTNNTADKAPLIGFNRYPKQIIGVGFRLPDSKALNGRVSHHALSIIWASPARWWRK